MKYFINVIFVFVLIGLAYGQNNVNGGFSVKANGNLVITDSLATIQHFVSENIKLQQQLQSAKIAALVFENDLLKLKNLNQQVRIDMQVDLVNFFSDERVRDVSGSVLTDMIKPEFYKRHFLSKAYALAISDD